MTELADRYVTRKHESQVSYVYPDGRFVVATTTDPDVAAALVRAVLELNEETDK